MIYFTGDIHGVVDGVVNFVNKVHPSTDDVIVLLGDVGANYYRDQRDRPPYRDMLKQNGTAGEHGFSPSILI